MNKYLAAIHENVCSVCVDSSEAGNCLLTDNEVCAVEKYLPEIVEIVHSVQSENINDYIEALHDQLCSHCRAQDSGNYCELREDANCALDRYFPLIVEVIHRVDKATVV